MAVVESQMGAPTRALATGRRTVRIARAVITVLFVTIMVINLGAFVTSVSPFPKTHLTAVVLSLYLLFEARLYLRRSDAFGLLSPAFLALFFHFVLSYLLGITASAFEPSILQQFGVWLPDLDSALASTMLLVILAAFFMLRGYALGQPIARALQRSVAASPMFRRDLRPSVGLMLGIQVAYLALVAYAIHIGVYGLLSTPETRARHADVVQFLNLFIAAGTLSYFLILLRYFERREKSRVSSLFGALVGLLIALHVMAGALSAFKSQIVFPFVLAGFAYFIATRRIPLRFIAYAAVALVVAYAVIEPFRAHLGLRQQPPDSIAEAVQALGTAIELREQLSHASNISRAEAIAQRFDLLGMSALAVDHVDQGNLQGDMRREFQDSILLAPILAYVPRAIWPNKPSYSQGVWFNQNVRGRWQDEGTSVGMGPIGYLYMAGGIMVVAAGFLGFGFLQALIFDGIARGGAGGLIIFLSVARVLVQIPTSFGPAVTGVLRMLPIAFVTQLIFLRRRGRSSKNDG